MDKINPKINPFLQYFLIIVNLYKKLKNIKTQIFCKKYFLWENINVVGKYIITDKNLSL